MQLHKGVIMPKRRVFYSFDYDQDVFRVQLVRNMGTLFDNKPVIPSQWEEIKRGGNLAIKKWIDEEMAKCSCVIVLIGSHTYSSSWVKYEIQQAWALGKGLLGVYIHNLKDLRTGTCSKGLNPFSMITVPYRGISTPLSQLVRDYDPPSYDAYNYIYYNLSSLVEDAIANRYRLSGGRL